MTADVRGRAFRNSHMTARPRFVGTLLSLLHRSTLVLRSGVLGDIHGRMTNTMREISGSCWEWSS